MSFKKNIIANYASQIYMSLAGVLILPLYLKYMGAEAYGLIGFFATLQVWFNMLDMGLNPSVARETTRMRAGVLSALDYHELFRALQVIFFIVMLMGAGSLFLLAHYISHSWLQVQTLALSQVETALQLMAVGVALRWMSSLYRSIIYGAEQFVWLSYFNGIFTTLRYAGVLLVLIYIGTTPTLFFLYQIIVSGLELALLARKALKDFPIIPSGKRATWSFTDLAGSIKPILPFALGIAVSSSVWVVITQTDKLILSKLLTLTEYGYFTLGVLAASGVMLFSAPFSAVLMPRMAKLRAEGDETNLLNIYRQATQFVAAITLPACLILALFPEQILWIWTNNIIAAQETAQVLRLYALGNAALSFSAFPYYLQYAFGTMRLHLIGNTLFATLLIPSIIWATMHYGMIGAAWVWFLANLSFFIIWTAIVHHHLVKNLHARWLLIDILPIVCISALTMIPLQYYFTPSNDKLNLVLHIVFISTTAFVFNVAFIFFPKGINKFKKHFIFKIQRA